MPNPIRSDRTHHAGHARPTAAHAHGRPVRRAAVWSSASDGRCHRFSMSPPSVRCQRMTSGVTEAMGSRPRTAACTGVATPVHANEPVIAPPIAIPARYSMYWMSSIGIGMRHRMRSRVRIRSRRDDMGFRPFSHDPACRPSKRMSGRVGAGRETRACAADGQKGGRPRPVSSDSCRGRPPCPSAVPRVRRACGCAARTRRPVRRAACRP